jgi:NRPS condensation-like uncharacterized protein
MISACLFQSTLIAQEKRRHYLDYFASHLRLTQQKLHGQDNHATVAAFEGNLDKNYFIKALKKVFQAHPNLRVKKIKFDDAKQLFYVDEELKFSEIVCKFVNLKGKESWRTILEKELSTPFPKDGPYWKVYCLTDTNGPRKLNFFMQFFDHSLSDGVSTAQLNAELFTYYDALVKGRNIALVKDRRIAVSLLTPEKPKCSWEDYKKQQNQLSKLYPSTPGKKYEQQASFENRQTKAILFSFELGHLSQFCKAHKITVNDLLVAANLIAFWKNDASERPLKTTVLTCINLRNPKFGFTNFINENNLACLFNIVTFPLAVDQSSTIFNIAKKYRELAKNYINALALPPVTFSIEEMCDRYGINAALKRPYFTGGIATSNLGKIALKKQSGGLNLVFYQFFTNQGAGFFEALLDVSCVENTLYCNLTYVEPLHSYQWAKGLVLHFIQELELVLQKKITLIEKASDQALKKIEQPRQHPRL